MPSRFDPSMPLIHPLPDPDRVELRAGLAYTEAGGRKLAMDLYRHCCIWAEGAAVG
jgi:hypothetical protein